MCAWYASETGCELDATSASSNACMHCWLHQKLPGSNSQASYTQLMRTQKQKICTGACLPVRDDPHACIAMLMLGQQQTCHAAHFAKKECYTRICVFPCLSRHICNATKVAKQAPVCPKLPSQQVCTCCQDTTQTFSKPPSSFDASCMPHHTRNMHHACSAVSKHTHQRSLPL